MAGVASFNHGDFSAALESFSAAYRLAPHPSVRVNIANCYMQLHRPVDALTYFEAFLAESPTAPAAQRDDVRRQIEELRGQIAEVHVGLSPDGVRDAIVSVDGSATAIQNVVRMMPGRHVVEASAEGFVAERTEVQATAGMRRELVIRLRTPAEAAAANTAVATNTTGRTTATAAGRTTATTTTTTASHEPVAGWGTTATTATTTTATASAAPTTTGTAPIEDPVHVTPPDRGPRTLSPIFFYAGVGLTGAALITWAACGIAAVANNGVYEDARTQIQAGNDIPNQTDRGTAAMNATRTLAPVSDAMLVATLAFAGTTAFLFTRTRFESRAPAVVVAPMGGHGMGGFVIGGRF